MTRGLASGYSECEIARALCSEEDPIGEDEDEVIDAGERWIERLRWKCRQLTLIVLAELVAVRKEAESEEVESSQLHYLNVLDGFLMLPISRWCCLPLACKLS